MKSAKVFLESKHFINANEAVVYAMENRNISKKL